MNAVLCSPAQMLHVLKLEYLCFNIQNLNWLKVVNKLDFLVIYILVRVVAMEKFEFCKIKHSNGYKRWTDQLIAHQDLLVITFLDIFIINRLPILTIDPANIERTRPSKCLITHYPYHFDTTFESEFTMSLHLPMSTPRTSLAITMVSSWSI